MNNAAKQCRRCGNHLETDAPYCPFCGARIRAADKTEARSSVGNGKSGAPRDMLHKVLIGMVGILVVGAVAILMLMLDEPRVRENEEIRLPAAAIQATQTVGIPTPEPTPSVSERISGTWVASRLENNSQKSKTILIESTLGDQRTTVAFLPNKTAVIVVDQMDGKGTQAVERSWYVSGNDVFIDYGDEVVDGVVMFGRTRYSFVKDELYSVYTLDGKDVTDYTVFSKSEPPQSDSTPEPEEPFFTLVQLPTAAWPAGFARCRQRLLT